MGLSREYFWDLTWYEWGLEVLKLNDSVQQKISDWESYVYFKRMQICDFRNAHFRNEGGQPLNLKPEEFWPLSFDKNIPQKERPLTFKEQKQLLGSRFKRDGGK
jgi:hypothetical protein